MKKHISQTVSWSLLAATSAAALIVIFFADSKFYSEYVEETQKIEAMVIPELGTALVEIDFGNSSKRLFEGDLHGGSYPLTVALNTAAEAGNFSYKIEGGKITSLARRGGSWKIYHNGSLTNDSIDTMVIKKGDMYSFRLQ